MGFMERSRIKNVFFDNNVLHKGQSAIRFKSNLDRGGVVEHVRVRNFQVESFDNLFWFQLNYPSELGGHFPATYRDIVFENFNVKKAGVVLEVHAPQSAPLESILFKNIKVDEAEEVLILENVRDIHFENVQVGDEHIDGMLSWRDSDSK